MYSVDQLYQHDFQGRCLRADHNAPALGPISPLTQWVQGALSTGVKLLGLEADHWILSGASKIYITL
jgi:hypothetical protein